MEIVHFIIYALAVWRISNIFVREQGPWNVFEKLRDWSGIEYEGMIPSNLIGSLLSCTWCFSVWIAFVFVVLIFVIPAWSLWIAMPFALSAAAILVDNFLY